MLRPFFGRTLITHLVTQSLSATPKQPFPLATSQRPIHTVKKDRLSSGFVGKSFGTPAVFNEVPKLIVFAGNTDSALGALERIKQSAEYYKDTKFVFLLGSNFAAKTKDTFFDQPWGQAYAGLSSPLRHFLKEQKKYDPAVRPNMSSYGALLESAFRASVSKLEKEFDISHIQVFYDTNFSHLSIFLSKGEFDSQPILNVITSGMSLHLPSEGALVYNHAHIYGRLTTGNHQFKDSKGRPLEFSQGVDIFNVDFEETKRDAFACFGVGLSTVWAAGSLLKSNQRVICFYDNTVNNAEDMMKRLEANPANRWIKENYFDKKSKQFSLVAIQDCVFYKTPSDEWEVELPTGGKVNLGKELFDFTGYSYAEHLVQQLPESMVYSIGDAGLFLYPLDEFSQMLEEMLEELLQLTELKPKDKELQENIEILLGYAKENFELRKALELKQGASGKEILALNKEIVKNIKKMRDFVIEKNNALKEVFDRCYKEDYSFSSKHVPTGAAASHFILHSEQFGHQDGVGIFELYLFRNASIVEEITKDFFDLTGVSLTKEIIDSYFNALEKQTVYSHDKIIGISLEERVKCFKEVVLKHYPTISKKGLDTFCKHQEERYYRITDHNIGELAQPQKNNSISKFRSKRPLSIDHSKKHSRGVAALQFSSKKPPSSDEVTQSKTKSKKRKPK